MHSFTYPKSGEKQKGERAMDSARLPPLKTSRKSNTSLMRTPRTLRVEKEESAESSSAPRRVGKAPGRSSASSFSAVERVMEMNKKAMALLKNGKMKESSTMLQSALSAAERGVGRFQREQRDFNSETRGERDAWLLAFAATLSNLGCVRRRDHQLQEAVRYLKDASKIEVQVFGKPSCSTMVNLSAVLLGMGETEEALCIARDCVVASEHSDPMLHIIALHNYGVTLSNHPTETVQQSAAAVLMKALREAESHLGKEHPTTVLIREQCGMSSRQPSQERSDSSPTTTTTTIPVAQVTTNYGRSEPLPPPGRMLPPIDPSRIYQKQARDALSTLDYGEVPVVAPPPPPPPPPFATLDSSSSSPPAASSVAASGQNEGNNNTSGATGGGLDGSVAPANDSAVGDPFAGVLVTSSEVSPSPVTPEEDGPIRVPAPSWIGASTTDPTNPSPSVPLPSNPIPQTEEHIHAKSLEPSLASSRSASVNSKHTTGASVSWTSVALNSRPTMSSDTVEESAGIHEVLGKKGSDSIILDAKAATAAGSAISAICNEIRELQDAERKECAAKEDATKLASVSSNLKKSSNEQIFSGLIYFGGQKKDAQPSFLRFAPPPDTSALTPSEPVAPTSEPAPVDKFPSHKLSKAYDFSDSDDFEEPPVEPKKVVVVVQDIEEKPVNKIREVLVRTIGANPVKRREERIKREHEEEKVLRARLRQEAQDAARQEHFERTLNAIISRTRERAARVIQYFWFYWWNSIGKRRRILLNKREEDRARRARARQALLDHERRLQEAIKEKKAPIDTPTVVLAAVLRCGKKWLSKTACVRYVARKKIPRDDHDNAYYFNKIAKIQAVWRGCFTRCHIKDLGITQKKLLSQYRGVEAEEYAATVIQLFVRRVFARMEKQRRAMEYYSPPTIRIQQWFRCTMSYRRALGIDRVSKWRREYSARLIQRAWRAYLLRLRYFMDRLRYKLDEDKRRERLAVYLLSRVGRGFISRKYVSKLGLRDRQLYNVMYALEWGKDKEIEKVTNSNALLPTQSLYVPTPAEEVYKVAEMEREKYHIGLFVDVVAKREREQWKETLRIRPFEVHRRRAQEDHLCEIELNTSRRERAAVKIQTEFRRWLRIRDDPHRDKTLLLIGRGRYQQSYYGHKVERVRHFREQGIGKMIFGDQVAPMRVARMEAQEELEEVRPLVRTFVLREAVRSCDERYRVEKELQRDELLVEQQVRTDSMVRERESRLRMALREQSWTKSIT